MKGISDKTLHSTTFRYLIFYLAIMTTVTFFLVGYNQSSVCSTQRDNVDRTLRIYHSIEHTIEDKIVLYEGILNSQYPTPELKIKLQNSIISSKRELNEIQEDKPQKVECFIF